MASKTHLTRQRTVAGVRRAQSPVMPTVARRTGIVAAYVEHGAGQAALRIAAEGAAMRSASLHVLDHIEHDAAEQLVRESAAVDLLVIGSRSDASTDTLRFDAIARTLAHRARCPVMFVPAAGDVADISEVVCGVDRSTGSAAALRWAARESAMRGGTVLAQQVLPRPAGYGEEPPQPLSSWVFAQQISEPTTIMCRLVWGASPAADLVHTALQRRALLVVGSHRNDGGRLHRCIAGRLAGHTAVPVVVVPPEIPDPRMGW